MTTADRPRGFLASLERQDRQRAAYLARHGLAPTPMPEEPWPVEHRPWWRLLADEIKAAWRWWR
ncbi:hypothetical protein [Nocardia brasiliensis]|uniref:hypothetical protein n=1 Tax=Nocardia brasiliensis TaxID=37326 RepID=UPI00245386A1|nr:hypothetical protein [Nocardia brasiliensis]